MDAPAGGKALLMAAHDQVHRHHVGHQPDVGIGARGGFQRLLHRPAGRIIHMDDAAVRMPALTRQMPSLIIARD
jgi:hypothetical protein